MLDRCILARLFVRLLPYRHRQPFHMSRTLPFPEALNTPGMGECWL